MPGKERILKIQRIVDKLCFQGYRIWSLHYTILVSLLGFGINLAGSANTYFVSSPPETAEINISLPIFHDMQT